MDLFDGGQLAKVRLPSRLTEPRAEACAGRGPQELLTEASLEPVHGDAQATAHLFVGHPDGRRAQGAL